MIAKNNPFILGVGLALLFSATTAYGQCTGVTVSGGVYSGQATVTYTLNALGEPIVHRTPVLAPLAQALTPFTNKATVMIQNMDGGAIVGYGAFTTENSSDWSACLPAGNLYIAMFSATGHDLTSRVFDLRGDAFIQGVQTTMITDAYLPALNMNLDTGVINAATEPAQPLGNLLVYAFDEREVNGAPDWPTDFGLPNTFIELYEPRTGNIVASGYTMDGAGGPTAIQTADGLAFGGAAAAGLVYLQNIPPGVYQLRATPPNLLDGEGNAWTGGWYHTFTMEGTQEWEILTFPGDPGTEAGGAIAWFGFVKKLGQLPAGVAGAASSISGVMEDADVPWENVIQPAACIPGVNWDPNLCEAPEAGAPLDPNFINPGVTTNGGLAEAFLVLWQQLGDAPRVVATAETDATGAFSIDNIPAGTYTIYYVDKALNNIFGEMIITVDGVNSIALPIFANETPGMPLVILARFFARVRGHVIDDATGMGINGATVNLRYQAGNVVFSTVTAFDPMFGDGWYNFDALPEVETMAMIDVTLPAGSSYRGKIVTNTYYPNAFVQADPNCDPAVFANCPIVPNPCNPAALPGDPFYDPNCVLPGAPVVVDRNGMGRWVQYYTANYQSDLILEPIPAAAGQIQGIVYNDSLAMGTWMPDGTYDNVDEAVVQGATIELLDAAGGIIPLLDALTGMPVTDPITGLPVQDPATVTTTGAYDPAVAVAQGYIRPGISVPPDEWGGFFSGPMPGFYEFRDVAPGTYTLRLTLPTGFHAPGEAVDVLTGLPLGYVDQTVLVSAAARNDLDIGVHSLVPRAGQLEGGIFADQTLDLRWFSAFSEEKALLTGLGVVVRDYLGFTIDTLVQPSGVCYPGTTPIGTPGGTPSVPYGAICDRPDLGNSVEIDRLVAPGLHLYWGNDPLLPECDATRSNSPCQDPTLFNLELPYTMNQGMAKYEADWSLPAAILPPGGPPPVDCATAIYLSAISGGSAATEGTKWSATANVTVMDPLGPLPGALVFANWSTGGQSAAITNGNGNAVLTLETVENQAITSVTATISVMPGEGAGGTFAAACGLGDCVEIIRPADGGGFAPCVVIVCGDGTCDAGEDWCNCPADCGLVDSDTDGVADCADICPNDPLKTTTAGLCGCGNLETDTDGDGTPDCIDGCPNDAAKIAAGDCGCGVPEGTCAVCAQNGAIVSGLNANAINMGEGKWRIEMTVNFQDLNCGQAFALDAGDKVWFTFGNGESKKVVADGTSTSVLIKSETIEGGGPTMTFTIDNVEHVGYAGGMTFTVVARPF